MDVSKLILVSLSSLFVLAGLLSFVSGEGPSSEFEIAEQCIMCHEERITSLQGTPHALPSGDELTALGVQVFCQNCHVRPEKHLEEPSVETATRPSSMSAADLLAVCSTCHSSQHISEFVEGNPHFADGLTCASCHKVHNSQEPRLLKKASVELCLGCHRFVSESFNLPSHHPVKEGNLRCVDCHNVLDTFDKPFSLESSRSICVNCHTEYDGPFPYEHEALNDYTLEEHGCLSCHEAHGSVNRRLLKQPDERLCLQCHMIPKHLTAHDGIWADRRCQECHSDIHGSYSSRKLFSEDMLARPCFRVGCHSY